MEHALHRLCLRDGHGELLRDHDVSAVADVRSALFSRSAPQFNKEALQSRLQQVEIGYVGKELGARTSDRSWYINGQVQYALLSKTERFGSGIDRLLRGAEDARIAVMCTERDPRDCHRTLLVTRALVDAGAVVDHVLPDRRLESNDEAMTRLLEKQGVQPDLFRSSEELLAEALQQQERAIAYVDQELVQSTTAKDPA